MATSLSYNMMAIVVPVAKKQDAVITQNNGWGSPVRIPCFQSVLLAFCLWNRDPLKVLKDDTKLILENQRRP